MQTRSRELRTSMDFKKKEDRYTFYSRKSFNSAIMNQVGTMLWISCTQSWCVQHQLSISLQDCLPIVPPQVLRKHTKIFKPGNCKQLAQAFKAPFLVLIPLCWTGTQPSTLARSPSLDSSCCKVVWQLGSDQFISVSTARQT